MLPLLFTIILDSLGFGLVFPIFSPLVMDQGSGLLSSDCSLATRGLIFGCLISCFCLGQFFGSPILGAISDRKGRKKTLIVTIFMALAAYLLAGLGILWSSVIALFISRIMAGFAAGNFAIAQSMVVDMSKEGEKTKNFGLIGMAWGLGFIIGPYLGGKLSNPAFLGGFCNYSTPFWFAAILCLLNLMVVKWQLKESLSIVKAAPFRLLEGVYNLKKAFTHPTLRWIFAVMFIFSLGWGFFTEFSPIFLIRRFNFDGGRIGDFYACVGIWVAICQGLLIRPFLKYFTSKTLFLFALLGLGIVLPMMLLIENGDYLFWIFPLIALPEALIYPSATTIVSDWSEKDSQGEMLGIHNSIQWAAIGFCPLFSGAVVALYPHLPVTVASICMFLAFAVLLWSFRWKKKSVMQNLESS